MNSYPEENASKYRGFLLKRGIKTFKKSTEGSVRNRRPSFDLVVECHRIPSKGFPKKIVLKLSHRKDSRRVLLNKKKLKQLKSESLNLPASLTIYINGILCSYYKKLWTKCQKLSHMTVIWRSFSLVIHWLQIPIRFYINRYG